jgi:hypothetical protein
MKIIDRDDFKMFVHIGECKSPGDVKVLHFIREEFDKNHDLILRNTYEFFMNKDEMKKLAKVLNEYE